MSIFIPFSVQAPVFEKMLLKSTRRITHDLEAVAVVVREISSGKLKPILVFFITWSISKAFVVQTPYFEKMLVN